MSIAAAHVASTQWLVSVLGGSFALAHVHAGLAIYVATQVAMRDRRASLCGLIAVGGAEIANEILEAAFYRSFRWGDTLGDIALTLLWPTILYGVARHRRHRWAEHDRRRRARQRRLDRRDAAIADGAMPAVA